MKIGMALQLAAVIAMTAGALGAQTLIDGQGYILKAPGGMNHWFLAKNESQAASIYAFRDDADIGIPYLAEHEGPGDLVRYSDGIAVTRVSGDDSTSLVRAQDGTEGWVPSELIVLTPDAIQKAAIAMARKRADQNAAAAKKKAEQKAMFDAAVQRQVVEEAAKEAERKRLQATCSALFRSTADRKVSDLTVRETQRVNACEGLGMYHS